MVYIEDKIKEDKEKNINKTENNYRYLFGIGLATVEGYL